MKNLKVESFVLFGRFKFEDVKRLVNTHSHFNINMQPQTTSYTDSIVVSINVYHKANMTEDGKKKQTFKVTEIHYFTQDGTMEQI